MRVANGIPTTRQPGPRTLRRSNNRSPGDLVNRCGHGIPGSQKQNRLLRALRSRRSSLSEPKQTCQVRGLIGIPIWQHTPRRKEGPHGEVETPTRTGG